SWHRRVMDPIIHFLERRSEACLTYSSVGKAYYERLGIDSHKIFVALNVVDTEQRLKDMACFDRSLLYRDIHSRFDFVVLYVGVLTKEKKVDVLLKAFAELEKFVSQEVCLLIVGKGEDDARLRSLAREWNIRNIQFVGEQRDGVSQYFFKADVMVLPGLGGLAISDALLHGVPVIATAGDGCEVDLINKNNGVLDEDLNEERLCGYLKKMCEDQPYKQRLKSHAQDIINNRYNIHTYVQGWVDCLSFVQPVMTRKS
ncbi:MAG TPA: glycosyltransferase, partial [bacterium]|nr:glycosyltransferase [bacterium]